MCWCWGHLYSRVPCALCHSEVPRCKLSRWPAGRRGRSAGAAAQAPASSGGVLAYFLLPQVGVCAGADRSRGFFVAGEAHGPRMSNCKWCLTERAHHQACTVAAASGDDVGVATCEWRPARRPAGPGEGSPSLPYDEPLSKKAPSAAVKKAVADDDSEDDKPLAAKAQAAKPAALDSDSDDDKPLASKLPPKKPAAKETPIYWCYYWS